MLKWRLRRRNSGQSIELVDWRLRRIAAVCDLKLALKPLQGLIDNENVICGRSCERWNATNYSSVMLY